MPIISTDVKRLLNELGFSINTIVETIVTTTGPNGPNAAPMGVIRTGDSLVEIRPYKKTRTYLNLKSTGEAVINVSQDVEIFYATAFKEGLSSEIFETSTLVSAPRLRGADAFVEVKVVDHRDISADRAAFMCDVMLVEVRRMMPRVFNRGTFATIEAMINATRIKPFLEQGRVDDVKRILETIDYLYNVVERVCPKKSPHVDVMNKLMEKVKSCQPLR